MLQLKWKLVARSAVYDPTMVESEFDKYLEKAKQIFRRCSRAK